MISSDPPTPSCLFLLVRPGIGQMISDQTNTTKTHRSNRIIFLKRKRLGFKPMITKRIDKVRWKEYHFLNLHTSIAHCYATRHFFPIAKTPQHLLSQPSGNIQVQWHSPKHQLLEFRVLWNECRVHMVELHFKDISNMYWQFICTSLDVWCGWIYWLLTDS